MDAEFSFRIRSELEIVPKPEDAGTLKIFVRVLRSDILIHPRPVFVLSYKTYEDFRLCNDRNLSILNDLLCSEGFPRQYVSSTTYKLTEIIFNSISFDSSQTSAISVYMTCKISPPRIEEEAIQASFDETTNNIRFKPASKLAVDSLSRKVYKTNEKKMCRICLEDFKKGEIVVTLPCGHEFEDSCIVEWFGTGHVCPLCRFELPCEEMN